MKLTYFTDIHLCEGHDFRRGFERCLESMLSHQPQLLINGGDLGITPEALTLYDELTREIPVPILHSNGNHEICSGYISRQSAGTTHHSTNIAGVHFAILDLVRYFEPTQAHPANWHVLADETLLAWLEADLSGLDPQTSLFIASHVPLSTSFPIRNGLQPGMEFPTNEVANADRVLELLQPFTSVATLHGHDHENCRHFVDQIEVMTTAAVAGAWWKNGLDSRCTPGREPPGYRLIEVDDDGRITNRYIPYLSPDEEPAEYFAHTPSGRRFINVYDGSPKTQVEVGDLGPLNPIDPLAESSLGLSPHFYELPADYDRARLRTRIRFEDGRIYALELTQHSGGLE